MNSWHYHELQRQIEYKAKWVGIPVVRVPAWGTSSKCSACGNKVTPSNHGHRMLYCAACGIAFDRDENAAKNILMKGGLRFRPDGPSSEAMVEESNRKEVSLKVDDGKMLWREVTPQASEPKEILK